jgi:tripartite-type tricarboxylate transporter receptor subunit TctC
VLGKVLLAIAVAFPPVALAQAYPSKPVRIVVPYPAGTTPDIIGRTLAERLQKSLGQPFVVENRSGAGGNIGAEAVAKAPADGYTLLVGGNGPIAINKHLYQGLSFDSDRDFAPLSLLATAPQMLVVRATLEARDLKDLLEIARKNPGRLSYASVGSGSASHLTMELLKSDARVDMLHVPYRGFPPAATDMLAGSIDAMFAIAPAVLPHVRSGKMKALAVTALQRSPLSPDVPSVAELGLPGLESLAWNGFVAPAGTPAEVVSRLGAEAAAGMRNPETREALARLGFEVVGSSPAEFARWIRAESEKWAKVIRASGAKAE